MSGFLQDLNAQSYDEKDKRINLTKELYAKVILHSMQDSIKRNGVDFQEFSNYFFREDTIIKCFPSEIYDINENHTLGYMSIFIVKIYSDIEIIDTGSDSLLFKELFFDEYLGTRKPYDRDLFKLEKSFVKRILQKGFTQNIVDERIVGEWFIEDAIDKCASSYILNLNEDGTFTHSYGDNKIKCSLNKNGELISTLNEDNGDMKCTLEYVLTDRAGYYTIHENVLILMDQDLNRMHKYKINMVNTDLSLRIAEVILKKGRR